MRQLSILLIIMFAAFSNVANINAAYRSDQDSVPSQPKDEVKVENDSAKVTQLEELVVKSERTWFEGDKLVCVPSKREKNVSNSPETLIQSMAIPMLKVNNGKVSDVQGNDVVYYINGVKATVSDIASFWPKDALRVEYMRNPADPKYEGAPAVVNFVMHEYETGGVTKLWGYQSYPIVGIYEVSSKLVYKNMTYGAVFNGHYNDKGKYKSENFEEFKDIFYNGDHYNSISHGYNDESQSKSHSIDAAVNARYKDSKFEATHTLALKYMNEPERNHTYTDSWAPDLFNSTSSLSNASSKNIIPSVSGSYNGNLKQDKLFILGEWRYTYLKNRNYSISGIGNLKPFSTSASENVDKLQVLLQPSYRLNSKWLFLLRLYGGAEWMKTVYTGSTDAVSRQKRLEFVAFLKSMWQPMESMRVELTPQVLLYRYDSGSYVTKSVYPSASLNFNWYPTRKLSLSAGARYNFSQPSPSQTADVLVRSSELWWVKGNPDLKIIYSTYGGFFVTYLPFEWLYGTLYGTYLRNDNNIVNRYSAAPADLGGLIRQSVNTAAEEEYTAGLQLNVSFFHDALRFGAYSQFQHQRVKGEYARHLNWVDSGLELSYSVNNFWFSAQYTTKRKFINEGGMGISDAPYEYNFKAAYGNGNWHVGLSFENIFRKDNWVHTIIDSRYYSADKTDKFIGRRISLNVSYTFGYGKRVDENINIDKSGSVRSGIVGM